MILSKKDSVMKYLIELPDVVSVFPEKESKLYEIQVRKMIVDKTLPAAADDSGDNVKYCQVVQPSIREVSCCPQNGYVGTVHLP